ncbi:MFS transporter permease [Peribacillus sp. FSL H8-0477]|uniref:MFS transporter permease n=1 Tax=Peribacillus sp. FSL H8-0477 TaxID=2921388 RepID=UPI0030F4D73D
MKKSYIVMLVSLLMAVGMMAWAFVVNDDVKVYLPIFFAVGLGLALLRVFVNSSIKKMKGKSWLIKIVFFAVLLGFGLPFQSWFRNKVLFSMDTEYIIPSIIIMVLGVLFMTPFFSYLMNRLKKKSAVSSS